jgi:hypothetical protein
MISHLGLGPQSVLPVFDPTLDLWDSVLRSGLGLGLTMWDLSNMLVGWFIGHFGLFGADKEIIQHPLLNYVGLVLASVSLIFFSLSSVLNSPDKELSPSKKEPREDCDSVRLKIQNQGHWQEMHQHQL